MNLEEFRNKDYIWTKEEVINEIEKQYPEMCEEFWKVVYEQYDIFCRKMKNYGPSNISVGTTLSTPDDIRLSQIGLFFRMNDKVSRLKQLSVLGAQDAVGETLQDTYQDLSVYGIIAQLVSRSKWAK